MSPTPITIALLNFGSRLECSGTDLGCPGPEATSESDDTPQPTELQMHAYWVVIRRQTASLKVRNYAVASTLFVGTFIRCFSRKGLALETVSTG